MFDKNFLMCNLRISNKKYFDKICLIKNILIMYMYVNYILLLDKIYINKKYMIKKNNKLKHFEIEKGLKKKIRYLFTKFFKWLFLYWKYL